MNKNNKNNEATNNADNVASSIISRISTKNINKKQLVLSALTAFVLTISLLYRRFAGLVSTGMSKTTCLLVGVIIFIVLSALLYLLFSALTGRKIHSLFSGGKVDKFLELRPRNIIILCVIMLIVWLPTLFLMRPFYIAADTMAQLLWSQGYPAFDPSSRVLLDGYAYSDHHPLLATLIYGFFYDVGQAIGNPVRGIQLYLVLQIVICACVFSYMTCWMKQRGVPTILCVLGFLFWTIFPGFPIQLMQVVKDITSMPFFMMWIICFTDCILDVRNGEHVSVKRIVCLVIFATVASLLRKTLIFIIAPCMLILLCMCVKNIHLVKNEIRDVKSTGAKHTEHALGGHASNKIQTLKKNGTLVLVGLLIPVIVVLIIFPKVVLPLANCAPAGPQESISVPIQQVSSIVAHDLDIDEADKEVISAVLPYGDLKALYTQTGADAVKDKWNRDSSSKDKIAFLLTWAKLGFKYPIEYMKAIKYCLEYFTVGSLCIDDVTVAWWGWSDKGGANIFPSMAENYVPAGHSVLHDVVVTDIGQKNPISHMFFDRAVYCFWVPLVSFCLIFLLRRRRWSHTLRQEKRQEPRHGGWQGNDWRNSQEKSQELRKSHSQRNGQELRHGRNKKISQGNLLMFLPIALSIAVLFLVPAPQARYGFNMLFLMPYILTIGYFRWIC